MSVVGGFWLIFHTFPREGGPRILRSIHVQTSAFLRAPRIRQSRVRCLRVGGLQESLDLQGDDFRNFPCCRYASCLGGRRLAPVTRQHGRYGPEGKYCRGYGSGICKAGFAGFALCAVILLLLSGPDALHHGRYGPDSRLRTLRFRQWHVQGWFYWSFFTSRCGSPLSSGQRCSASWPVRTRRTVYRGIAACAGLGLLVSLLALIFLRRCQALMPCIMAGMDQINSYVVFVQGHQNPSRGAEAVSFGSETMDILHLQFIDTVSDVCCAGPAISGADWEKTAAIPQLQLVVALRCCDMAVVCNNSLVVRVQETAMSRSCCSRGVELIMASCHRSLKSCRCSACSIGCRRCISGGCRCACRALCTGTGPGLNLRHEGGEG